MTVDVRQLGVKLPPDQILFRKLSKVFQRRITKPLKYKVIGNKFLNTRLWTPVHCYAAAQASLSSKMWLK